MARREVLFTFFVCSLISLAANFQYGFSSTYLNAPVDEFKKYINESFVEWNRPLSSTNVDLVFDLISNIWFVGFFCGIFLSPLINDRFGRKVGFVSGNLLSLVASCLRAVSIATSQPELLFIGRLLASICTAVTYQSCILYLQECSPTALRGVCSFLSEISYAAMALVGMFLGTNQLLGRHLFWLMAFAIPPCLIAVLILLFLPETPKFLLIVRDDKQAAAKSIYFYHGTTANAEHVLNEIEQEAAADREAASSWRDSLHLFQVPHLRKALALSCAALQNTVPLWAILLNSTQFLQDADVNDWNNDLSKFTSTAMAVAYVVATILACIVIERVGRRPLLLGFSALNALSIVLFVVFAALRKLMNWTKYGCVGALLFYGFTYGGAVGPVSWFISAELVPQRYRSLTQSLSYAINTISVVITTFTVMPLYNVMGPYAFLPLYTGPSIICLLYLYAFLPETTGREIHDIVDELKGGKPRRVSRDSIPDDRKLSYAQL